MLLYHKDQQTVRTVRGNNIRLWEEAQVTCLGTMHSFLIKPVCCMQATTVI